MAFCKHDCIHSYNTIEDRLKDKIAVTDKILQRYRQAEVSESKRLVPVLEKIGRAEESCFKIVDGLLGKCANFDRWGGLKEKCQYMFETLLRHETEVAKVKGEIAIKELERQINVFDQQTELVLGEGSLLVNYACTTYGELVVTIEEMLNYHHLLQYAFDWEYAQLMKQREQFERKTQKRIKESMAGIKAGVRKDVFSMMDPMTLKMGEHNKEMTVILNQYKDQMAKKQEAIKTISDNIKKLENDPKIDTRKRLFPEMFYNRANCTPDMEFKLDIPIKKYIPI